MISIKIKANLPGMEGIDSISIPNQDLITGLLKSNASSLNEILSGLINQSDPDNLMIIFAWTGNAIMTQKLDPAQKNALKEFVKNLNVVL